MYSRKNWIGSLIVASMISSCAWVQDRPKSQLTFNSKELDLSCLQTMPDQVENLFAGKYTSKKKDLEEIQSIWKCLDQSLNSFSKYTYGSNREYYSNQELMDFANRFLPKDSLFSESFVDSIFRLKADVLGGTTDKITHQEIDRLRGKLNQFGKIILPLAPHISTLLKPFENLEDNRAQIAGKVLNKFVIDIADLLGDSAQTVSWSDLSYFVGELEKYLKAPNPTSLSVIREQLQVFQYLKLLVVGGNEFGIEKSKWHPILKSISVIYNALYLTTSTRDMLEQLSLEIQSTDQEQKIATEKLTFTLKSLKYDPDTYTKSTINLLSDRWAKALILNAFLFPDNKDHLSIRNFFSSPTMRKVTGYLVDDLIKVMEGDQSAELISKMAERLIDLVEQARVNQSETVSIQNLKDYAASLKILFETENEYMTMDLTLSMLEDVSKIMIGKESGYLSTKDLRALITKLNELYGLWNRKSKVEFGDAISQSMDIILKKPGFTLIQIDQVKTLLKKAEQLFSTLNLNSEVDWQKLIRMVEDGARLKSILFESSEKYITNNELKQIMSAWNAFNEKKELDEALENLSRFFEKNPFVAVKISALAEAIDAFLPEGKKLGQLGLTPDLISNLKEFLIGGSSEKIEQAEYAKVSKMAFKIYRNLKPVLNDLPEGFKAGLNSQTIALVQSFIQGMMDEESVQFSNDALKKLMLSQLNGSGMNLKPQTADKLIIALNHRILDGNKNAKPKQFASSFSSKKLTGIRDFLNQVRLDYRDLEIAFRGVDQRESLNGKEIYDRLSRKEIKTVLTALHPIIDGKTGMPYFASFGKPNSNYSINDLYYKDLIYHALLWLLPKYEIEADPKKPSSLPRLTMNDLFDLFDDISDAVFELGLSFSPDAPQPSAIRRMQSINVFTRTGNGDGHIDVFETIDFLTTTFAGKNLFDEVRNKLVERCYPENLSYKTQDRFTIACLKNHFFSLDAFDGFYDKIIPQMTAHYRALNPEQRDEYRKSVLVAAISPDWKEDGDINLDYLETLVSIPYYSENIFLRLDTNYNNVLTFSEAMKGFPVFCGEIKKAAGDSIKGSCAPGEKPKQIEAIYGHLLMKGVPPRSISPDDSLYEKIRIGKEFLSWVWKWSWLNKDPAERDRNPPFLYRKDLMSIIANLSTSITPVDDSVQP